MVSTTPDVTISDYSELRLPWRVVAGKRYVRPYFFEFFAHVKRTWAGKIIVDLYADEFKGRPYEYYVRAVQTGRFRVEGARVAPSFVVRDSQKMSHFVHRHEPPVIAGPIKILEEGPDVITVCKPPSIPVHPCGQYRKNTVVGILEAEHKTGQLFLILCGPEPGYLVQFLLRFKRVFYYLTEFCLKLGLGQNFNYRHHSDPQCVTYYD